MKEEDESRAKVGGSVGFIGSWAILHHVAAWCAFIEDGRYGKYGARLEVLGASDAGHMVIRRKVILGTSNLTVTTIGIRYQPAHRKKVGLGEGRLRMLAASCSVSWWCITLRVVLQHSTRGPVCTGTTYVDGFRRIHKQSL